MSRLYAGFTLVLFFAAAAAAQPTFVTLSNGALVPCDHPLALAEGKGCTAAPGLPTPIPAADSVLHCNPYDLQQLATAPECESFRHPHRPPVTHLDDFQVGHAYADPYGAQVRVLLEGMKTTAAQKFWVVECLNHEGSCLAVGQVMTFEDRHTFILDVPTP